MQINYISKMQLNLWDKLIFLAILLVPFSDCGLSKTPLHEFGRYLSNIPLIFMLLLLIVNFLSNKINCRKLICTYAIFLYIILFSLFMVVYIGDDLSFGLYKIFSQSLTIFFWLFFYYVARQYDGIGKVVIMAFFIHVLGCMICDWFSIDIGEFFHTRESYGGRYRGFSSESSVFGYTLVTLGGIALYEMKNRFLQLLTFVLILSLLILGGSKGSIVCFFISAIVLLLISRRVSLSKRLFIIAIVVASFYYIADAVLADLFMGDLEQYTSFATRASLDIAYINVFITYPLGTGLGAAITVVREFAYSAFMELQQVFPIIILKDSELLDILQRPDGSGILLANTFLIFLLYFGIPFLVAVTVYIKKRVSRLNQSNRKMLLLFLVFQIMANCTYMGPSYPLFLSLAYIDNRIGLDMKMSREKDGE